MAGRGGRKDKNMKWNTKIAVFCAVLICIAVVAWMALSSERGLTTLTYSQFMERVRSGQVANVVVMSSNSGAVPAVCRLKSGESVRTVLPPDYRDAMAAMQEKLVNVEIRDSSFASPRMLANAAPFLLLLVVWIVLMILKFPNGRGIGRFST
jgi:ATP-dependent Zn protease